MYICFNVMKIYSPCLVKYSIIRRNKPKYQCQQKGRQGQFQGQLWGHMFSLILDVFVA